MFFRKKTTSEPVSVAKKGIKKMDTVVTGVILSGIIASIYGVKKIQQKNEQQEHTQEHLIEHKSEPLQRKKSLWRRLFRR